jgi:site-specific DNA-methyltransferase (cytosine-N4-specific)
MPHQSKTIERPPLALFHSTMRGEIYHGDSLDLLTKRLQPASVDLIMTSPPFGLVRKKEYGNVDADKYVEWFKPFAEAFERVVKDPLVHGYKPQMCAYGHEIEDDKEPTLSC